MVNEMVKIKQMMGNGSVRLCRAAEAMPPGPMHQALIENDGVEPVQGPSDCNGPVVHGVQRAIVLIDGRHQKLPTLSALSMDCVLFNTLY